MGDVWDAVVVGAGIVGCWTAYHLAKNGKKVILLEQFALPHNRGSSNGHSRIMRSTYSNPIYTKMTIESTKMWRELESISNQQLLVTTGLLMLDDKNTSVFKDSLKSLQSENLPHEVLDNNELARRFPMLKLSSKHKGILDKDAGLLLANRILSVLQKEIVNNGGVIHDGEPVMDIIPSTPNKVVTRKQTYLGTHVVLCPGPWAKDLLAKVGVDVPLKTMPGMEFYCETQIDQYSVEKGCPIIYEYIQYDDNGYRFLALFPELEFSGMVKMVTRGEPPPHYAHPNQRDKLDNNDLGRIIEKYAEKVFDGVSPTPVIKGPCVYTMTPDKDFVIDRHPKHPNILLAVGMSGHGFKMSPLLGKVLMELVCDKPRSMDISLFAGHRFSSKSKI